jgi:hypothetical protein
MVEVHSLLRTLNQQLDPLTLLNLRKRTLRILKLDLAANQFLDRDASSSYEVHRSLVVAGPISERALDVQLLCAHCHDREVDVWLAHAALCIMSIMHSEPGNLVMYEPEHMFRPSSERVSQSECMAPHPTHR